MIVVLLALSFLCGLPAGTILGMVLTWHMLKPAPPPVDNDDIDYAGGL